MNRSISIFKTLAGVAISAMLYCGAFVSCETFDDTQIQEAIKDLQNRVTALEKKVQENISALQQMVSLGSIASCEYNSETGKAIITLVDGKTITIDQQVKGVSLVTVVEKGGKYYWGICKDGKTSLLEINGKNVPVEVTPSAKISDKGEWLISADGGNTWVNTGIFSDTEGDESVEFFKDVAIDGDYLILTLADGNTIKVEIVGEAEFSVSETSLWFTRKAEEKMLPLTINNVKAFTITEKPEGWKAVIREEMLHITSPADLSASETSGTVKILAVFNGRNPEIVSIDVQYEPEFTLTADTYGTVKVKVSEHVGEDYAGYLIKAWKSGEFTAEAAAAWLNSEGYAGTPCNQTKEYNVSELADSFQEGEDYAIFAVSYIPARFVSAGERTYAASDLVVAQFRPVGVKIKISDIRFDSAHIQADFSDVPQYFGGISKLDDWNNYVREDFLEQLGFGGMTPLEAASYEGDAAGFPDGINSITIVPSTEYVAWMIPYNSENRYSEEDFITKNFTTPAISAASGIAAPSSKVYDVVYAGFTADITPAAGAYKTYATILPAASIPASENELVTLLVSGKKSSEGSNVLTVSTNSYSPEAEVYLLAVSLNKDGGYGSILKEQVKLKELVFSDAIGISKCDVTYGLGDVTLNLTFTGSPKSITYIASTYLNEYYTDEMLHRMMAMKQYGDATTTDISKLQNGNQIYLNGLQVGAPYTFYAVVHAQDGTPSHLFKAAFTPSMNVDYILADSADYEYGLPRLSGEWKGSNRYILSVEKPAECVKYWLFQGDPEYFLGDVWSNTDKLVAEELYGIEVHTDSFSNKTYSHMHSESRFYVAWVDDKGKFHAIYEYNPHN
jgi:hypothetical protein